MAASSARRTPALLLRRMCCCYAVYVARCATVLLWRSRDDCCALVLSRLCCVCARRLVQRRPLPWRRHAQREPVVIVVQLRQVRLLPRGRRPCDPVTLPAAAAATAMMMLMTMLCSTCCCRAWIEWRRLASSLNGLPCPSPRSANFLCRLSRSRAASSAAILSQTRLVPMKTPRPCGDVAQIWSRYGRDTVEIWPMSWRLDVVAGPARARRAASRS